MAVAAQQALARSLLELPPAMADECDGAMPPLAELLADLSAEAAGYRCGPQLRVAPDRP